MEAILPYNNKMKNTQGKCIPNSYIQLCDGTIVKCNDSTEFYFRRYHGNEDNRIYFHGMTEKGHIMFQSEGPLAAELKEQYQGCDWPTAVPSGQDIVSVVD